MNIPLIKVQNLQVTVETKTVIDGIDLIISRGEVAVLIGANGSGKSSLAQALMGDTRLQISDSSKAQFEGQDLLKMTADERARAGLFVAWQDPVSIPGVSVFSLCKASFESRGNKISELVSFKKELEDLAIKVGLPKDYIGRNVNDGFSGGEKKRLELLQLLLLKPKLAILDEVDSGLDVNGVKILIGIIADLKKSGTSFILISHNTQLLHDVVIDKIWEMKNGKLSTGI